MVQDNFLLVTDSVNDGLFQVDLSTGSGLKIPLSQQTNPIAIAYDPMDSKIYWTDVQDKVIKRSNLDGSVEEVVKSLHKGTCPCIINLFVLCCVINILKSVLLLLDKSD